MRTTTLLMLLLAGCDGTFAGGVDRLTPAPSPSRPEAPPPPKEPVVVMDPALPPSASMAIGPNRTALGQRRLTRAEYLATVTDLVGQNDVAMLLTEEPTSAHFSNNAHGLTVSAPMFDGLVRSSERLGSLAADRLTMPTGCSRDALNEGCVTTLLGSWLGRAFRRPPTTDEVTRFRALFTTLRMTAASKEALAGVLQATLLSSAFLYRFESDSLDDFELASRLSYFVWGSMPDDALLEAARAGQLRTKEGRLAQLSRMWASPRAKPALLGFVKEWLGLQRATVARKDPSVLAGTTATLQADLELEFQLLVERRLLPENGSLEDFLGGTTTYLTPSLAQLYGLSLTGSSGAVSLVGTPRRGALTSGLVIAAHSKESGYSVPQFGHFFRKDVLCQPVPAPPVEAQNAKPPAPLPGQSYRQTFEGFTNGNPNCNGCHSFINPPGFAYLPFDPIGRLSALDSTGKPHQTATDFLDLDGETVRVKDAAELAEKVAHSRRAKACATRMAIEALHGRTFHEDDKALLDEVSARLTTGNDSLFTLVQAVVGHESFTRRGPLN